jgi:hypothetical protein
MVIERVNCAEVDSAARFATERAKDIRALKARGLKFERHNIEQSGPKD